MTKFSKTFVEEDLKLVDDHLELEVALTQEDTLSFKYFGIPMKDAISIQIKLISSSGDVCASEVMLETVGQALYGRML